MCKWGVIGAIGANGRNVPLHQETFYFSAANRKPLDLHQPARDAPVFEPRHPRARQVHAHTLGWLGHGQRSMLRCCSGSTLLLRLPAFRHDSRRQALSCLSFFPVVGACIFLFFSYLTLTVGALLEPHCVVIPYYLLSASRDGHRHLFIGVEALVGFITPHLVYLFPRWAVLSLPFFAWKVICVLLDFWTRPSRLSFAPSIELKTFPSTNHMTPNPTFTPRPSRCYTADHH